MKQGTRQRTGVRLCELDICVVRDKEYGKALEAYREVQARFPEWNYAEHALMMGICQEKIGLDNAIECYERAINMYPDLAGFSETTYFYLGSAYLRRGERRKGTKALRKAIELGEPRRGPDAFPCKEAHEWLLSAGRARLVL